MSSASAPFAVDSVVQRNRASAAPTASPTALGTEVRVQHQPTRQRLTRLPRTEFEDQPRYFHPNGYVIARERRTWSERGRTPGRHHDPPPALYWWRVQYHVALRRDLLANRPAKFLEMVSEKYADRAKDFGTLGEARAWCDEHTREGWDA